MNKPSPSHPKDSPRVSVSRALLHLATTLRASTGTLARTMGDGFGRVAHEIRLSREALSPADMEVQAEVSHIGLVLSIAGLATALVYLGIFLPLAWTSASDTATSPLDVIFLQRAPSHLEPSFFSETFPRFSRPEARPLLFALGVLYGATGLALPFAILPGNLPRLFITANGIFNGFLITKLVIVNFLQLIELDPFSQRMFNHKLAYIGLTFYVVRGSAALLGGDTYRREKFDLLGDGLFGLFSGWLLARGFGAGAAFFSGGVYLTSTFISIWFFEKLLSVMGALLGPLFGPRLWLSFERIGAVTASSLIHAIRRNPRAVLLEAALALGVFSAFPLLAAAVYHLLLEGRF